MTKIKSAFLMVERRWAMTKEVRPFVRLSIASWINSSVLVSTLEVASSRMSKGAYRTMARAMVINCFWPAEIEPALSRWQSNLPGKVRMK